MPAKRAQSAGHSLVSTRSVASFLAILLAVDLGFRMHTLNCHRWTPSPIFHQCTPSLQAILLGSVSISRLSGIYPVFQRFAPVRPQMHPFDSCFSP
ncbi:unnamed protein product [Lampetra fluviatilis]